MCMSGAAPLSAELTRQFMEVLPGSAIGQGYGTSMSLQHHDTAN